MTKRIYLSLVLSALLHVLLIWLLGFASMTGIAGHTRVGKGYVEVRLRPVWSENASVAQSEFQVFPQSDSVAVGGELAAVGREGGAPLPVFPTSLHRDFDRGSYYSSNDLDVRPSPEQPIIIELDDPNMMEKNKGQVVLLVYVSPEGAVDNVEISSADAPMDVANSLMETFRAARMRPGIKSGQPVRARMKILVEFEVR